MLVPYLHSILLFYTFSLGERVARCRRFHQPEWAG